MKTYLLSASLLAAVALSFDQLTKYWAHESERTIVNAGVSFGLFFGSYTTVIVGIVLVCVTVYILTHQQEFPPALAGLFLGASTSNLLDRIAWGGVRDFMNVPLLNIHNNLADWIIAFSVLAILIKGWLQAQNFRKV